MILRYLRHLWDEMSHAGRQTFPWDVVRGVSEGALGAMTLTFGLLVAIRNFDASLIQKSMIAGAPPAGMLFSLLYASWSPVLRRKSIRAALPMIVAAGGIVLAARAPNATLYTAGMCVFGVFTTVPLPIMTAIYSDNYRMGVRGQVFGVTVFLMVSTGLVVQLLGGRVLDAGLEHYRHLFMFFAALAAVKAFAVLMMPDDQRSETVRPNPLTSFAVIRHNRLFGYVLAAWFLMGFANLALQPQRIEYLSQPRHGLELAPGTIVLIAGVTMEVARLCTIPLWARLFDRLSFIWVRIMLTSLVLCHVLIYYHTTSIALLVPAVMFLGASLGGGAIAWTLWVTKFAPPAETARYMSIHTFMTGVRGSIAPLVGYLAVEYLSIQVTSRLAAVLVFCSIALLWRIRHRATPA